MVQVHSILKHALHFIVHVHLSNCCAHSMHCLIWIFSDWGENSCDNEASVLLFDWNCPCWSECWRLDSNDPCLSKCLLLDSTDPFWENCTLFWTEGHTSRISRLTDDVQSDASDKLVLYKLVLCELLTMWGMWGNVRLFREPNNVQLSTLLYFYSKILCFYL